jgi:ABC-type multidrug transport system fused ATPase/permease subunit
VLARATAKVADDRHATVAAFVADLTAALDEPHHRPGVAPTRPKPTRVENPYVGLLAFEETDAERFHGRETVVTELVETLETRPFVAVVGPSGSGKSSVVRAGFIPAVRRGAISGSQDWFIITCV